MSPRPDGLETADGQTLRLHCWPVGDGVAARGTVQLVHGLGEHAGRYASLAAALNAAGWTVVAHDHRGHGASSGPRGGLPHATALLEDLARVIDHWRGGKDGGGSDRGTRPGGVEAGPQVLLGHSMGGLIAARFVAEGGAAQPAAWWRPFDGLVLSSPALDAGLGLGQRLLLTVAARLAPDRALGNGLEPDWVSRDPAVVRAYVDDPLNHDRITPRLVRFIVDGGQVVRERASAWRVPTLLMYAGADRCVAPAGSAAFAAAAPADVVQASAWPALFHEIFNEPEREAVVAALLAWLDAHFPRSPA
jgi:alpha-beta hydrolase superfamily lysophospholipase